MGAGRYYYYYYYYYISFLPGPVGFYTDRVFFEIPVSAVSAIAVPRKGTVQISGTKSEPKWGLTPRTLPQRDTPGGNPVTHIDTPVSPDLVVRS